MTAETINFGIENENNNHRKRIDELKRKIDELKRKIEEENKRHQRQIEYLRQQKANAVEDERRKNTNEEQNQFLIEQLNRKLEFVLAQIN